MVRKIQETVGLEKRLWLVVARSGQGVLEWSREAGDFGRSIEWEKNGRTPILRSLRPISEIDGVVIDPLRSFGEPAVRGVRTDIIGELVRAGDSREMIADLYELEPSAVDDAARYELMRLRPAS